MKFYDMKSNYGIYLFPVMSESVSSQFVRLLLFYSVNTIMPRRKQVLRERRELPEDKKGLEKESNYFCSTMKRLARDSEEFSEERFLRLQKHDMVDKKDRARKSPEQSALDQSVNVGVSAGVIRQNKTETVIRPRGEINLRHRHERKVGKPAILRSVKHIAMQMSSITDDKGEPKTTAGNEREEIIVLKTCENIDNFNGTTLECQVQESEWPLQYELVIQEENCQEADVTSYPECRTIVSSILGREDNILETQQIVFAENDANFPVDCLRIGVANNEDSSVPELFENMDVHDLKTEECEDAGDGDLCTMEPFVDWEEEDDKESVHFVESDLLIPDVLLEEDPDKEVKYEPSPLDMLEDHLRKEQDEDCGFQELSDSNEYSFLTSNLLVNVEECAAEDQTDYACTLLSFG